MSNKGGKRATKPSANKKPPSLPSLNDEMLYDILHNTHEGIVFLGDDFKVEYVNDMAAQIFGGVRDDLLGQDFRKFLPPEMVKVVSEYYLARRRGEDVPTHYPMDIIRKDGAIRTFEARVSMIKGPDEKPKTIAHLLDITKILADREAREESETRYELLVETMNDGLVIDDPGGNLVYTNEAFSNMIGYTSDEIVGKPWIDLTDEMSAAGMAQKIAERRSGKSESYELCWTSKTGEIVPTIVSATPYIDREGKFIGTFAVVTEISAQKDAEETMQFYLDLLSHDIANQLQVIMTSSGMLEEEVPPSYVVDARQDILDAVERCNRLITKVKRAAQIRNIPISKIDVIPVINEKVKILERVYGATVHIEGAENKFIVEADVLLGEMIWNLLENSARHNPKDEKQVWISCESVNGACNLTVADDGSGLSDMRKNMLFTERKYGGGVGLTLVNQMIRKYGGSITVTDRVKGKPAMGAKFVVTLKKASPRKKH
ncbi:MAG: PAS domain-containing sensor histidine kinase [Candidatus Thorarchaeota archaeon]